MMMVRVSSSGTAWFSVVFSSFHCPCPIYHGVVASVFPFICICH